MVSVGASTRFTAQVTLARKYTVMANALARQFGVKLDASAAAYDDQEVMSAEMLGSGGSGGAAAAVAAARTVPAGHVVPADLVSGGTGAGLPAGEVPASPRDMARLIETGRGGTGKTTWQAVETSLRCEAKQLGDAADQLGAAISTTGDGWQSQSADAATTQMRVLQTWYEGHARYVQGLAEQAKDHVQNFSKALTDVPPYRTVLDAERELKAAMQSNARAGGAHRAAVVHAQMKVSKLYQASTTGFTSYTFAESAPQPTMPTPPPGPSPSCAACCALVWSGRWAGGVTGIAAFAQERPLGPGAGRSRCGTEPIQRADVAARGHRSGCPCYSGDRCAAGDGWLTAVRSHSRDHRWCGRRPGRVTWWVCRCGPKGAAGDGAGGRADDEWSGPASARR